MTHNELKYKDMEILKEFANKHKQTIDTVKGIIEETKTVNPDNYDFYSGVEITILKPQYDWLAKHNNGDIIPMRHTYKGDVITRLEISEKPFYDFFRGYVPDIKKYWGTDKLIIKNHTFESLDELLNSKIKTLEMAHRVRKNSLKKTGKYFISSCLKDLEGNQVPTSRNAPVWVTGIVNKEHPILKSTSAIKELMFPIYEDAEKNLKGIVIPYTFSNGATTDLKLKNIEFWVLGGRSLEVKLIFHFYKNKEGSYGTHRTYSIINEIIKYEKDKNQ